MTSWNLTNSECFRIRSNELQDIISIVDSKTNICDCNKETNSVEDHSTDVFVVKHRWSSININSTSSSKGSKNRSEINNPRCNWIIDLSHKISNSRQWQNERYAQSEVRIPRRGGCTICKSRNHQLDQGTYIKTFALITVVPAKQIVSRVWAHEPWRNCGWGHSDVC